MDIRQSAITGVLLGLAGSPALAQAPVYNWTGFYVGVHAGYGLGTTDLAVNSPLDIDGFLAGGQIGINQQIGNVVFGIEGDLSWGDIAQDRRVIIGGPGSGALIDRRSSSDIDWLAAVSLRMGLAIDRMLVYGKFGAAWAHGTYGFSQDVTIFAPPSSTSFAVQGGMGSVGPLLGFGAEYTLSDRWSARLEYNYIAFPEQAVTLTGTGILAERIEQHLHLLKLGVNYRFGLPAPLPQVMPARATGYDWTGFYVGAQAGYGFGRTDSSDIFLGDRSYVTDGWFAGGQIGANVQAGVVMAGIEADWIGANVRGGETALLFSSRYDYGSRLNWLATVTGRVGVAPWSGAVLYAKAGGALAEFEHARNETAAGLFGLFTSNASGAQLFPGYVVGAGLEHMLFGNWSARVEYNYVSFIKRDQILEGTSSGVGGTSAVAEFMTFKPSLQLVKLGINYRFAPPPP
jgi:opacity protein-like surface antigen